jgi:hypothetical protein
MAADAPWLNRSITVIDRFYPGVYRGRATPRCRGSVAYRGGLRDESGSRTNGKHRRAQRLGDSRECLATTFYKRTGHLQTG